MHSTHRSICAQVFEYPRRDWIDAPKGMMYRGAYTASDKFVDGDGRTHLEYDYPVKVTK